jgi:hypothetical protein
MPNPLSTLGAIHTLISVLPVGAAIYGFSRYGGIEPQSRSGQLYIASLVLSVFTAFGLSSTGHFNAGHALGILALLAVVASLLMPRLSFLGRARPYLATLGWSFSVFLLLVPGINETLSRLPVDHPLANGPTSPVVQGALLAWVLVFIVGYGVQAVLLKRRAAV